MRSLLGKIWKALKLLWMILGAFVFFCLCFVFIVSLQSSKKQSPADFCEAHQVGSSFKAIEIPIYLLNVSKMSASLQSQGQTIHFQPGEVGADARMKAEKFLLQIDQEGLYATLRITDTFYLLKKTCQIEFEQGRVLKATHRTWD